MYPIELSRRSIGPFVVWHANPKELDCIYTEIFDKQEYRFTCETLAPVILDCGAHIGLSILYFKSIYPCAKITAFEPDPLNLQILRKNILENQLQGVTIIDRAVADKDGSAIFYREHPDAYLENQGVRWTWSNTLARKTRTRRVEPIPVLTTRLSTYLTDVVHFLKIDIEGAEQLVIDELGDSLDHVQKLAIEYHGHNTSRPSNDLDRILQILSLHNFQSEVLPLDETNLPSEEKNFRDRLLLIRSEKIV